MPGEQGVVIGTKDLFTLRSAVLISHPAATSLENDYASGVVKGNCKGGNFMSDFTNETIKTNPIAKFKEVKVMTFCGLMAALAIVLGKVATIKFGPYIKVGFSGLPNRIVDYLFGPVVGAIFGGALDII